MPRSQQKEGFGGPETHPNATPPSNRSRQRSAVRSRIFKELVVIATEQGASIPVGISTGDALQQCLDRAVALWNFAASQVDALEIADDPNVPAAEDGFFEVVDNPQGPDVVTANRWYVMEREARLEIEKLAAMMTQLGIAERVVRVEEAKAALLVAAVRDAAMEAGLDHDQVRALGVALRHRVEQGLGQEKTPARRTAEEKREIAGVTATMSDVEQGS